MYQPPSPVSWDNNTLIGGGGIAPLSLSGQRVATVTGLRVGKRIPVGVRHSPSLTGRVGRFGFIVGDARWRIQRAVNSARMYAPPNSAFLHRFYLPNAFPFSGNDNTKRPPILRVPRY